MPVDTFLSQNGATYRPTPTVTRRALLAGAAAFAGVALAPGPSVGAPALTLRRGGSIHTMMNWAELEPGSRDRFVWPPFATPKYQTPPQFFDALRATGVDFVRLTVDPGPFLAARGRQRAEIEAILLDRCRTFLDRDLRVIVDFHPTYQVEAYAPTRIVTDVKGQPFRDYANMIARAAGALAVLDPARVALEPFNEPPYGYDPQTAARWQTMIEIMHAGIRRANSDIPVIWSGARSGAIRALEDVRPERLGDDNVIWTFHYYSPLPFTHQGVRTSHFDIHHYRYLSELPFPASAGNATLLREIVHHNIMLDAQLEPGRRQEMRKRAFAIVDAHVKGGFGPENIRRDFATVLDWARSRNVAPARVLLGEFGVVRRPPGGAGPLNRHRLMWLREVREAAENHGFSWCLWDINQPQMGIVHRRDSASFDLPMLEALGLSDPASARRG